MDDCSHSTTLLKFLSPLACTRIMHSYFTVQYKYTECLMILPNKLHYFMRVHFASCIRLIHLLDLKVILPVVHIHAISVDVARCMVRHDDEPVVRPVEADLHRLAVPNLLRQKHDRQRVEQLALDGAVERPSAVLWRVPDGHEVLLGVFGDVELDLAVREALLDFRNAQVDNLEDVLASESTLRTRSAPSSDGNGRIVLTKITISSIRLMNSGGK